MKKKLFLSMAIMPFLVAACSAGDNSKQIVRKYTFEIPIEFIEGNKIPWLPVPSSALTISIPYENSTDKIRLSLDAKEKVCERKTINKHSMKELACNGENSYMQVSNIDSIRKAGDSVYWGYFAKIGGSDREVASCSPLKGNGGLCTSIFSYKDVIVTIYYNDRSIDMIEAMRTTSAHLSVWDTRNHDTGQVGGGYERKF